ncbi:MAG: transcription termination/antitermination factor NusG [Pirellulales bacterium]|nr:transcription termination/antitermination factor NusG [Pirellulales bacterium]
MTPDEDQTLAADDAVTNRSDDTALDKAGADDGNGYSASASNQPAQPDAIRSPSAEEEGGEVARDERVAGGQGDEDQEAEDLAANDEESFDNENEVEDNSPAAIARRQPVEIASDEPEEIHMDWYILKVQSNRERSIAEALERKMRIEGFDKFFDQVIVPTEKVTEFKGGKKRVVERKLYPGYIVVHMHINDETWFAVRETSGVGDFTGAGGKPTPMLASEVSRIVQTEEEEASETPKLDIKFAVGDKIKVKDGNFENFEGEVAKIDEASGRVTVLLQIFGRSTQVELEYWQIEAV